MWWLWLACAGGGESAKEESGDSACDESRYAEVAGETLPGWTPAAGCESTCAAQDSEGREYSNCYLTTENIPMCQYGEPCP